jgi:AraC family transcriptional regulator
MLNTFRIVEGSLPAWRARRTLHYIEENLSARITTVRLASQSNLSPSHFCRAFKRTFGVTVHAYVMRRRVEHAKLLMTSTSAALSDIAVQCGLSDQSHLTRWFRRVVGVTPGSWRRNQFSHRARLHAQAAEEVVRMT